MKPALTLALLLVPTQAAPPVVQIPIYCETGYCVMSQESLDLVKARLDWLDRELERVKTRTGCI